MLLASWHFNRAIRTFDVRLPCSVHAHLAHPGDSPGDDGRHLESGVMCATCSSRKVIKFSFLLLSTRLLGRSSARSPALDIGSLLYSVR